MPEISNERVSDGWKAAVELANRSPNKEVPNLILNIVGLDSTSCIEDGDLRLRIDRAFEQNGEHKVETVSNTIFPKSLWDPTHDRRFLYERYMRLWPRISAKRQNKRGTYFQRMISYPQEGEVTFNQLEHVIGAYQKGIRRRSTFQCGILVPYLDLNATPYQGFPCMQQVAFFPESNGTLRVSALYPMQYLWERAYGNYFGLIELGRFMAREMGLKLSTMTCVTLIAKLENPRAAIRVIGGDE
jgi:hypothetical protein